MLETGHKVLIYKQFEDTEAEHSISLDGAVVYAHVEKKGQYKPLLFNIRTNQDYLLRSFDKDDKDEWTKILKANLINPGKFVSSAGLGTGFLGKTVEERDSEKYIQYSLADM